MEKITMQLKSYQDGDRIREIFKLRGADSNIYDFNSLNSYYSLDENNRPTCNTYFPEGHRQINNIEELNSGTVYEIY